MLFMHVILTSYMSPYNTIPAYYFSQHTLKLLILRFLVKNVFKKLVSQKDISVRSSIRQAHLESGGKHLLDPSCLSTWINSAPIGLIFLKCYVGN
jgi:hypothetical protein